MLPGKKCPHHSQPLSSSMVLGLNPFVLKQNKAIYEQINLSEDP